jgi:hypothetical protein
MRWENTDTVVVLYFIDRNGTSIVLVHGCTPNVLNGMSISKFFI